MYSKTKPLFPKLHKCGWCKKRLNKKMPIVAKETLWVDGVSIDYFCSEKCAKAELKYRRKEQEEKEELNRRILL